MQSFDCTGYTLPVFDTIWAGLNGLGVAIAASSSDADWQKQYGGGSRSTTIVSGLLWIGISGASAAYGYSKAEACTNARSEMENREYFGVPRKIVPRAASGPTRPSWKP